MTKPRRKRPRSRWVWPPVPEDAEAPVQPSEPFNDLPGGMTVLAVTRAHMGEKAGADHWLGVAAYASHTTELRDPRVGRNVEPAPVPSNKAQPVNKLQVVAKKRG